MVSRMLKSEFVARNKFEKPRWKCPDCRTINKMDYNCSKCRKDCFSFSSPPNLARPDEKEEVKKEESPRRAPGTKQPTTEVKPITGSSSQKQSGKGSVYENNPEEYWECASCKTVNKTIFSKAFRCDGCNMDTFSRSRHLDFSREEILIGRVVRFWVCRVCRSENSLVNKDCYRCR